MKQSYRIYRDSHDNSGDRMRWVLWSGNEYPSLEDIRSVALSAQNEEHDPFLQTIDDYISVQKKRKIGWQTLNVINIFKV